MANFDRNVTVRRRFFQGLTRNNDYGLNTSKSSTDISNDSINEIVNEKLSAYDFIPSEIESSQDFQLRVSNESREKNQSKSSSLKKTDHINQKKKNEDTIIVISDSENDDCLEVIPETPENGSSKSSSNNFKTKGLPAINSSLNSSELLSDNEDFVNKKKTATLIIDDSSSSDDDERELNKPRTYLSTNKHKEIDTNSKSVKDYKDKNRYNLKIHNNKSSPCNQNKPVQNSKVIPKKIPLMNRDIKKISKIIKTKPTIHNSPKLWSKPKAKTIPESSLDSSEEIDSGDDAVIGKNGKVIPHPAWIDETDSESGIIVDLDKPKDVDDDEQDPMYDVSDLSDSKKEAISKWIMSNPSDPEDDGSSAASCIPPTERGSLSSGNASLERLEMFFETPNNRSKFRSKLNTDNQKRNDDGDGGGGRKKPSAIETNVQSIKTPDRTTDRDLDVIEATPTTPKTPKTVKTVKATNPSLKDQRLNKNNQPAGFTTPKASTLKSFDVNKQNIGFNTPKRTISSIEDKKLGGNKQQIGLNTPKRTVNLFKDRILSKDYQQIGPSTPKTPQSLIRNRNLNTSSDEEEFSTPKTSNHLINSPKTVSKDNSSDDEVPECADILDKLYGNIWRINKGKLPTTEPRRKITQRPVRRIQSEKKKKTISKKKSYLSSSSSDESDTDEPRNLIKNRQPTVKFVEKKDDEFINDDTLSSNEDTFLTALSTPMTVFNNKPKVRETPRTLLTQRAMAICDPESGDEVSPRRNIDSRKKLSFTSDGTSEYDPDDVIPEKPAVKTPVLPRRNFNPISTVTPKTTKSFLTSLSSSVPLENAHPDAKQYRTNFPKTKERLSKYLYKLFNEKIFDNKLPSDMLIEWNNRMRGTAGFCYNKKKQTSLGVERSSRIVLAIKIVDSPDRLRDTLVHELCHAATWLINSVSDGHGPFWKAWASKAMKSFPELPPIKRCHDYKITTKYTYRCTQCGYCVGRFSKSLDIEKKRCGHCYGRFELLINKKTKSGRFELQTPSKKEPTGFALFVKSNYQSVKKDCKILEHKDVMKILGQQFSAIKVAQDGGINSDKENRIN